MTRARLVAISLVVLALVAAVRPASAAPPARAVKDLPKNVWHSTPADEEQCLVFLGAERPIMMRFRVLVNEQGFRMAWRDYGIRLWRYLDRNKNGIVASDEYDQQKLQILMNSPFGNTVQIAQGFPGFDQIDNAPKDDELSLDEFLQALGPVLTPFVLQASGTPNAREKELFKLLDDDLDEALGASDLQDVARRLSALDLDDDELIVTEELNATNNPYTQQFFFNQQLGSAEASSMILIELGKPKAEVAGRIIAAYDNGGPKRRAQAGDQALARCEIGLSEASFLAADRNHDSKLSGEEVAAWLETAVADLSFRLDLSDAGQASRLTLLAGSAKPRESASGAQGLAPALMGGNSANGFDADLGSEQLALLAETTPAFNQLQQFYVNQFNNADGNKDGFLDQKESAGDFFLNQNFELMDQDADGKVSKKEVEAYAGMQEGASSCRAVARIFDKGRALFEAVDSNRDGRLSPRELRAANKLLELDRDGDRQLKFDELVHKLRVKIGRGSGSGFSFDAEDGGNQVFFNQSGARPPSKVVAAAPWFHRMDKNRDGDVSRREFLGPIELFKTIDADKDGLIDSKEAVAASDIDIFNKP